MAIGRQLKIYLHPADRPAVDSFVHDELASVLLDQWSPDPVGFEVPDSARGGMGLMICPRSQISDLAPVYSDGRREWALTVKPGVLIEWWFSKFEDGMLYPGRLYYIPPPKTGSDTNGEFLRVATALFKWMRKYAGATPVEWGSERLGPIAAEMYQSGKLTLRQGPPGSRY